MVIYILNLHAKFELTLHLRFKTYILHTQYTKLEILMKEKICICFYNLTSQLKGYPPKAFFSKRGLEELSTYVLQFISFTLIAQSAKLNQTQYLHLKFDFTPQIVPYFYLSKKGLNELSIYVLKFTIFTLILKIYKGNLSQQLALRIG